LKGEKLRVAQLGFGYWGGNVLRNILAVPRARVVAVADPDRDRLAEVKRRGHDVAVTDDSDEVLARRDVDAVLIVTPARAHGRLVRSALEAGKHVFVEKPLALDIEEARTAVELADRKRLTLMVGHTFLYATPVRLLKDYLDRGELGTLRYLYSQRLNLGRVQDDISVLWSVGPHDVSIFLHLLGSLPVEVSARGLSCLRPGIEDVVFLAMLFPDGVTAQTHLSWVDPCKVRRVTLVGGRKTAVYDDVSADARVVVYDRAVQLAPGRNGSSAAHAAVDDVFVPPCPYPEPLRVECEHFVDCVLDGQRPATDGPQGLDVVRVLDAAERSMAEGGRPVRLDSGPG
jgi:predicted dehydrogenase